MAPRSPKIAVLPGIPASAKAVLASTLERSGDVTAVVMVVRTRDSRWQVLRGGKLSLGSICMASAVLQRHVLDEIVEDDD